MKKIVKLVNIHDGNSKEFFNGNRMYVESFPRAEMIIGEFLSQGWKLENRTQRYTPAIQQEGCYGFYLGGCDFLFVKEVEDWAEDDGDKVLEKALEKMMENE